MATRKSKKTETETLATVKDLDVNTVINEVGNLQVAIGNTLGNVGAQLTTKLQQLQSVDEAINLKTKELSELYDIEKEALALEELKVQRAKEEKEWEEDQAELDRRAELNRQKRDEEWNREKETYEYNTQRMKERALEEHQATILKQKRDEDIRKADLERNWSERENTLAAKEKEFTNLQETVAGFEAELKKEVSKAEAIVANTLKRQHEHDLQLLRKDMDAERNLNATKIESLNATIASLQEQIEDLQNQLDVARNDAKEVATKALDSASNRQVADALRNVVDNQNQQTNSSKR